MRQQGRLPFKDPDNSPWFHQNAYTSAELFIHPIVTIVMAIILVWQTLLYLEANILTDPTFFSRCFLSWGLFWIMIFVAIFIKWCFFFTLGLVLGLEMMSPHDEFWLYDYPSNPCNVPSFLVFKRTKQKPEDFMENLFKSLGRSHRCSIKPVKILGKYYFQQLNDEEYARSKKTHTGIREDLKTDDELIEFGLKVKQLEGKTTDMCSVRVWYFPKLNEDEACIMAQGHHSYQDGISQMQSFYSFSDSIKQKDSEYPFFKKPRPSIF